VDTFRVDVPITIDDQTSPALQKMGKQLDALIAKAKRVEAQMAKMQAQATQTFGNTTVTVTMRGDAAAQIERARRDLVWMAQRAHVVRVNYEVSVNGQRALGPGGARRMLGPSRSVSTNDLFAAGFAANLNRVVNGMGRGLASGGGGRGMLPPGGVAASGPSGPNWWRSTFVLPPGRPTSAQSRFWSAGQGGGGFSPAGAAAGAAQVGRAVNGAVNGAVGGLGNLVQGLFSLRNALVTVVGGIVLDKAILQPIAAYDQYNRSRLAIQGTFARNGMAGGAGMVDDIDRLATRNAGIVDRAGLFSAGQQLALFKMSPSNQRRLLEGALNQAAVGGTGTEGLSAITSAFERTGDKDRFGMREARSLEAAKVPIVDILTKGLGMDRRAVDFALEKNFVNAKDAFELTLRYFDSIKRDADDLKDHSLPLLAARMQAAFDVNVVRPFGKGLTEGIMSALPGLSAGLAQNASAWERWQQRVEPIGRWLGKELGGFVRGLDHDLQTLDAILNSQAVRDIQDIPRVLRERTRRGQAILDPAGANGRALLDQRHDEQGAPTDARVSGATIVGAGAQAAGDAAGGVSSGLRNPLARSALSMVPGGDLIATALGALLSPSKAEGAELGTVPQVASGALAGLDPNVVKNACGPLAAAALARGFGLAVDDKKIVQQSLEKGLFDTTNGTHGVAAFQEEAALAGLRTTQINRDEALAQLRAGKHVAISSGAHYFEGSSIDARGRVHVGNSGLAMSRYGGSADMTLDEMDAASKRMSGSGINGYVGGLGPGGQAGGSIEDRMAAAKAAGDLHAYARLAAAKRGVNPTVFERQIQEESGFRADGPDSAAGARGIAQLMPVHWRAVDPKNPYASLDYAAQMDADALKRRNGDYEGMLRDYNAGPNSTNPYNGETNKYVGDVLSGNQGGSGVHIGSINVNVPLVSADALDEGTRRRLAKALADETAAEIAKNLQSVGQNRP
jgi:tape measure domain-containing protein